MSINLPEWISPHLFENKVFKDLSVEEISDLKFRLNKHTSDEPEVSIVIPTWNEGNNIYRTLSSIASNITSLQTEIVVINNNSTDHTQEVLDVLGVRSFLQPEQGTPHARTLGLEKARGKYHLCADSDTFYPPTWIDAMVAPMKTSIEIVGVYGRYSLVPPPGTNPLMLKAYEMITGILIRIRKYNREHINVLGFNMGFVTEVGRSTGGFAVTKVRKFDNAKDSDYFVDEAEDGRMAINLKKKGKLKLITNKQARAYTSSRRLVSEGGIVKSFMNRLKLHLARLGEYAFGSKKVI